MVDGTRLVPAGEFDKARHQAAPPDASHPPNGYVHDFLFLATSEQSSQRARLAALGIVLPPA